MVDTARIFGGVAFGLTLLCYLSGYAAETSSALEEITVEARKSDEKQGEVPISISVITAARLHDEHIETTADLASVIPNFSYSSNGNSGGSILEMRGVSSAGGASPVAVYLDDVEITSRNSGGYVGQPEPALLDVQQVEVLRGPQGTLYGASAEAGVLRYHTNAVDLTSFSGTGLIEISDTVEGGVNYRAKAVLNAPLVEGILGIRLAAQSEHEAGFIDQVSPDIGASVQPGVNYKSKDAARILAEGRPIDALTITAKLFYSRAIYGSSDTVTIGIPRYQNNDLVADNGSDTLIVPSVTLQLDAGWADITSVTADSTRNAPFNYDATSFTSAFIGRCILDGGCGSPPVLDLSGNLSGGKIAVLPSPGIDSYYERHISQEFRVSSKPYSPETGPVTWSGGLYFERTTESPGEDVYISQFNATLSNLYGAAEINKLFGGALPSNRIYFSGFLEQYQQYSEFADVTYHIAPALSVSAGLRYLNARIHLNEFGGGYFNGGDSQDASSSKDHALTPKASIDYHPSERTLIYATVSRGFRLGGPNAAQSSSCDQDLANLGFSSAPAQYHHDSLWNYELGAKSEIAPRVSVNVALFYDKWTALQQRITLPDCGASFTTNVGAALSYGAESDVQAFITDKLTLNVSAGYNHATLTEPVPSPVIRPGTRIEGVPDWSFASALEYRQPLTATLVGMARVDYSYLGTSHGTLLPDASDNPSDYERPSYGLAGASIGLSWRAWQVSVFAKNLLNNSMSIQHPDFSSVSHGLILTPRTVGLSALGKF